ncbi:hypothetical protein KC19_VG212100 [Ceratodon purpureus]|uniref:Uncharacterized protein n=1 Tax=Ceratodon purpureus TaxID=3225 RepID=A0A8T0HSU8_CERPU|nr:hypothetical protein KC19_VG212100 [Ceratodon purpureus]
MYPGSWFLLSWLFPFWMLITECYGCLLSFSKYSLFIPKHRSRLTLHEGNTADTRRSLLNRRVNQYHLNLFPNFTDV